MTVIPIIDGTWTCPYCLRVNTEIDEGQVIVLDCPHCGAEYEGEAE